jgi:hypothetical protein
MELSASRTVHGEREIQRVENDHFSGDAGRHRHSEYRTSDHNVRHKRSLAECHQLEQVSAATSSGVTVQIEFAQEIPK